VALIATSIAITLANSASACTFCAGNYVGRQTIRERGQSASAVVHGVLAAPRFGPDGKGSTDLRVTTHLRADAKLGKPEVVTIPQYLPVVGDTPREYLLFLAAADGKPDVVGGMSLAPAAVAYVSESLALPADPVKRLAFSFRHLDAADATVSADAFLEFAKASDAEITKAAAGFDVAKVKVWLADPKTPAERLGVYAVLLGLCGKPGDETPLAALLAASPRPERVTQNLGGLLAGLTLLNGRDGWARTTALATDAKAPFDERLAAVGTVRYFQATAPAASRPHILGAYKTLLGQGDLADVAAEDLRRWGWWDLSADVLAPFDRPSHKAPIVRQAIVRYALTCPDDASKQFVTAVRKSDPALVEKVEDGLKRFANPN
jgi:hypothetical protein